MFWVAEGELNRDRFCGGHFLMFACLASVNLVLKYEYQDLGTGLIFIPFYVAKTI